jgi:hypothetical protein
MTERFMNAILLLQTYKALRIKFGLWTQTCLRIPTLPTHYVDILEQGKKHAVRIK